MLQARKIVLGNHLASTKDMYKEFARQRMHESGTDLVTLQRTDHTGLQAQAQHRSALPLRTYERTQFHARELKRGFF
jgi:hypothetical protein